jgi:uncharacterized glyoxalase superfamily protein PhnB
MAIRPSITPCLVYEDAQAAIAFLGTAFGFQPQLVVPDGEAGGIAHAQLVLADGCMIMLSSARPDIRTRFGMVTPADTGGLVTACLCVALEDPDAHHARAAAAGAVIIAPPHDNPYGGRGYEAKDPEGNVWSFASYDPWAPA